MRQGALEIPATDWSDVITLNDDNFRFDEALRPTGVILAVAGKATFSDMLSLAVKMRSVGCMDCTSCVCIRLRLCRINLWARGTAAQAPRLGGGAHLEDSSE